MRRVFHPSSRRQRLQDDILGHVRRLRRAINPEVLDHARHIIETNAPQFAQDPAQQEEAVDTEGNVVIDQQKNLETIMQFLSLQPDNTALHSAIHRWLAESHS